MIKRLLFIHFLFIALVGLSQNQKQVIVEGEWFSNWNVTDTLELKSKTDQRIQELWVEGYLFAGLDSANETSVFFHKGEKIRLENVNGNSVSFPKLIQSANDQLDGMINAGFPFARLTWDSLLLENGKLNYYLNLEEGPLILNDSIVLISSIPTKREFIARSLGIQKGTPFREEDFSAISDRLERLSFLEPRREPDISFQNGKAWTYLDLTESRTGSFEGVLGVLPNQSAEKKALITGSLDLALLNLFRTGKELDFAWKKFGEESQILDLRYKHPFVAGSKLHVEGTFGLIKQDTSFINQKVGLSTSFYVANRLEFGIAFEQSNGDVIASDPVRIISNNWLDYQQNNYFISLSTFRKRISAPEPHLNYAMKFGIGERIISRNPNLPVERYDTINLQSTNLEFEANSEFQVMLTPRSAVYGNISIAHRGNPEPITNQLFRLGGLKTLRGFNEQFFFASSFLVSQLEWRVYFEEESFLFAFYDQGFLKNQDWSLPTGLGGGFSLSTNAGLFSFAMAVGKTKEIPFEFTNMKVHFGYLSRF